MPKTKQSNTLKWSLTVGESSSIDDKVTLPVLVTLNAYVMVSPASARPSSFDGMYETPVSDPQPTLRAWDTKINLGSENATPG